MSSDNPPYPYYNGIPFNPSFFTSDTGTGLTESTANTLYLRNNPISLPILDFSYFNSEFAIKILQKLLTLRRDSSITEKALQFLLTQIYEYAIPVETLTSISNVAAIASGNDPETFINSSTRSMPIAQPQAGAALPPIRSIKGS
jgi:hypothetical protein